MPTTLVQIVTRQDRWQEIFHSWRSTSASDMARDLTLVAAGVLLIAAGVRLRGVWRRRQKFLGAFGTIAGGLELSWADRRLLARIARQQQLPSPLPLLMSGATLRHHGQRYAQALIPARRAGMARRVETLCAVVFGG